MDENSYRIEFPEKGYRLRIMEGETKPNSKGNRMHTFKLEIFDAAPVNDKVLGPVDINGIQITHFVTLTEKSLRFVNQFRRAFGFENDLTAADIETDDAKLYEGKVGAAQVKCKKEVKLDGEKQPVTNLNTGEPMYVIKRELGELHGR